MTIEEKIEEGWARPMAAKKYHYFRGITSLCGRWMYGGELFEDIGPAHKDDCVPCRRELDKEKSERG